MTGHPALRSTRRFCAALICLLVMGPAAGQETEIFLGSQDDPFGTDPTEIVGASEPENHMARCLADMNDQQSCHMALQSQSDGGLESAFAIGEREIVRLDFSKPQHPRITRVDPLRPFPAPTPSSRTDSLAMMEADIRFAFNSDRILAGEAAKLDQVAGALNHKLSRGAAFLIIGHTDAVGSDAFNCDLSTLRAAAVAAGLEHRGVERDRLIVIGAGEHLQKIRDDAENAENRRVAFAPMTTDNAPMLARLSRLCR